MRRSTGDRIGPLHRLWRTPRRARSLLAVAGPTKSFRGGAGTFSGAFGGNLLDPSGRLTVRGTGQFVTLSPRACSLRSSMMLGDKLPRFRPDLKVAPKTDSKGLFE